MIHIAAAVEHHVLNALRLGTFGHVDAHLLGGVGLGALTGEILLREEAETRVLPFTSSMIWA